MRTIAVIQARLNSTRLPGKALLPLCGKSMTWHIVERCKRAKLVDEVVVAVPFNADNHALADHIFREFGPEHLATVPGDENDLLTRYYTVAREMKADFVVRVCGDNPCVEPEEIDHLIKNVCAYGDWRLLMNSESPFSKHDGFGGELYSMAMLEWMDEVIQSPEYREHPQKFWIRMGAFDYCGKPYPFHFRLEVNTMEDYLKLKDIFEHFAPRNDFTVAEVIEYLKTKPIDSAGGVFREHMEIT